MVTSPQSKKDAVRNVQTMAHKHKQPGGPNGVTNSPTGNGGGARPKKGGNNSPNGKKAGKKAFPHQGSTPNGKLRTNQEHLQHHQAATAASAAAASTSVATPKSKSFSSSKTTPSKPTSGTPTTSRYSSSPSPVTYAGSKCYEPPTPASLPKPPTAWVGKSKPSPFQDLVSNMIQRENEGSGESRKNSPAKSEVAAASDPVSQHLKFLLNVQA